MEWALRRKDLAEAIRLDRGSAPGGDEALPIAIGFAARGEMEAARSRLGSLPDELRRQIETGRITWVRWADLGMVEALLGRKDEALRCARKAVELRPESHDPLRGPGSRAALAFVHAWTGDKDAAIAEYAHLLRTPFGSMVRNRLDTGIHVMKVDPRYAPLRGDPRFEALLNDPKNNAPLF